MTGRERDVGAESNHKKKQESLVLRKSWLNIGGESPLHVRIINKRFN